MASRCDRRTRVIALVERQRGVISRGQLLALGVPSPTIQGWRRRGWLRDVHAGVYAWGHAALSWEARCVAAQLAGGTGCVISHAAAAALHGLLAPRPTIDVIAPRHRRGDRSLRVHRAALPAEEVTEREGIRVTTVERTLFDLCDGRMVAEAVARRLTTVAALGDLADRKRGHPGARRFARVVGLPQYRSGFERRFHRWLRARGFPEPFVNARIGRRTYDFVWPAAGLIVETDGPHHRTPAQRADDERAKRHAAARGFRVLRVPEERFEERHARVAQALWSALASHRDARAISM